MSLATITFTMRSSYLSYRYPNTEFKTSYLLLAAKTAAATLLKAFSFPQPSLTPSPLPSNEFFLKSVWREREEGWSGGEGTLPFCRNSSSCKLKRGRTCLLGDSLADTGALTRTGLWAIAQQGQSCAGTTAGLSVQSWWLTAQAAGHAQLTIPPCAAVQDHLCLPFWKG